MDFLPLESRCALNYRCFLCPRAGQGSRRSLPPAGWCVGGCSHGILSASLLPVSVWSLFHLLCRRCSVDPQFFFRGNCFVCRCKFSVFMGRGVFSFFLCCHFGQKSLVFKVWFWGSGISNCLTF